MADACTRCNVDDARRLYTAPAMTDPADRQFICLARNPDGSVEELPKGRIDEIDKLTDRDGTLVWVHATAPSSDHGDRRDRFRHVLPPQGVVLVRGHAACIGWTP
jgi:hypothetical protein